MKKRHNFVAAFTRFSFLLIKCLNTLLDKGLCVFFSVVITYTKMDFTIRAATLEDCKDIRRMMSVSKSLIIHHKSSTFNPLTPRAVSFCELNLLDLNIKSVSSQSDLLKSDSSNIIVRRSHGVHVSVRGSTGFNDHG